MKPSFIHTSNPSLFSSPCMAFASGLRFTTSSLIRYRLSHPAISIFSGSSRFRHRGVSYLRFLSTNPRRSVQSVKAKRRDVSVNEEGRDWNGSLLVKEEAREGRIVPTELHKEATEAYMAYAMSVLLGRALLDVRDGLKHVHRRIYED